MGRRRRVAVLISGRGSNLAALIDAAAEGGPAAGAEVVLALSDRPGAAGLELARARGVPAAAIDRGGHARRDAFEAELDRRLDGAGAELVCLAGFLRILSDGFVGRRRDRLLNVHPSLLPALPGLETHGRALALGLPVAGCTVHMVRAEVDAGPVLVQGVAPVLPGDTPEALAARVLELEHRAYPLALGLVAGGRIRVEGERAVATDPEAARARLLLHPLLLAGGGA